MGNTNLEIAKEELQTPWRGESLGKVIRLHDHGRELLEEYTMPDDIQLTALRYDAPAILVDDKRLSGRVRALINIFNETPQSNKFLFHTYLWGALIDETIGEELSDVLWNILSLSMDMPSLRGYHNEMNQFYKHLLYPLLPGSQGTGDILSPSRSTDKFRPLSPATSYHKYVEASFNGRIPLRKHAARMLNRTAQESYAISLGIPDTPESNAEIARILLLHWRTFTKDTLQEFFSLVQEYNVEWALAAMEWNKGEKKP